MTPRLPSGVAPKAVFFDLDGTLLHTAPDLAAAVNALLVDLGRKPLREAFVSDLIGKGIHVLVERALNASDGAPLDAKRSDVEQHLPQFQTHYAAQNGQSASDYPDMRAGLEAFAARGIQLGVITNKAHAFTMPLLEKTGLARFFAVVVSGDTTAKRKPDALPMHYACAQLGVSPSEALMIGDSGNDCLAARAAGMPVWVVPYGYNEGQPVAQLDCDGIVASLLVAAKALPA